MRSFRFGLLSMALLLLTSCSRSGSTESEITTTQSDSEQSPVAREEADDDGSNHAQHGSEHKRGDDHNNGSHDEKAGGQKSDHNGQQIEATRPDISVAVVSDREENRQAKSSNPKTAGADRAEKSAEDSPTDQDSLAIFKQRILPIMQAKNPSSCAECHLSGVDLKDYIRSDQAKTFAALRQQGLIDVKNPDNSKILRFIARKPKKSGLINSKVRDLELNAFRSWIRVAVKEPNLLKAASADDPLGATLPVEVIRHARKDRVLASFIDNIWSEVGRCAACHSPDRNQKQVRKHGEQVSWIKLRDPEGTMNYMVEAGLIDADSPEESLLLQKPTMQVEHVGGLKMVIGDRSYKQFRRFIDDYAAVVNGEYRSAKQLPKPSKTVSAVSEIWLKFVDVPARYDKMLLQVNLYRQEKRGWSKIPWAIGDRTVFGKGRLWQQHLGLTASRDSKRAKEIRETPKPKLPPGRYLAKIYIDTKGKLQKNYRAELGKRDFVGEVVIESRWPEGYNRMTTVRFPAR